MENSALKIIKKLQEKKFKAYFVGGCVRDKLLGKNSKDIDIVTNAKPEEIEEIFPKTLPVGKHFGIILVVQDDETFEVATFRRDGEYLDGRRPEKVHFSTPEKDAERRDFTINAIFHDPIHNEYLDFFEGKKDLKNKIVKFIGNPEKRILEDFLRIMRAVRFKNRLNFKYDSETQKNLKKHASLIVDISAERILTELNSMISHSSRAESFSDLFNFGILEKIFPQTKALEKTEQPKDHHSEGNVLNHTFLVLKNMNSKEDLAIYWAAFFHDWAKPNTKIFKDGRWHYPTHDEEVLILLKPVLKKLKFPKGLSEKILWLLEHKQIFESFEEIKLSKRLAYFDHPEFENLWKLEMADLKGCISENPNDKKMAEERLERILKNFKHAQKNNLLPSSIPEFFTGEEIILVTNLKPGPEIGKLKKELRILQLENILKNRIEAQDWLKK